MSDESNRENEMTNPTSDSDSVETADMTVQNGNDATTEVMPVQNGDNDTTETILVQDAGIVADDIEDDNLVQNDNSASESDEAGESGIEAETQPETETAEGVENETAAEDEGGTEAGAGSDTETGSAFSGAQQPEYVPSSSFTDGYASSDTYVRVPRDMPQQMPKPQPPSGPSKATIILSLFPLCLGALMLIVGSAFPMVFAPVLGGVDVRSMIALFVVVLGALLIGLAVLLGLASLIHKGTTKWKARRRR